MRCFPFVRSDTRGLPARLPLFLRLSCIGRLIPRRRSLVWRADRLKLQEPMYRRSASSFRLVLVAVLFGLSALCMMSAAHGREIVRHAGVGFAQAPPSICVSPLSWEKSLQHVPLSFDTNLTFGNLQHVSHGAVLHALRRGPASASLLNAACGAAPNFAESRLARENVLALGGAPRAPGPSRAPPAA